MSYDYIMIKERNRGIPIFIVWAIGIIVFNIRLAEKLLDLSINFEHGCILDILFSGCLSSVVCYGFSKLGDSFLDGLISWVETICGVNSTGPHILVVT